MDKKQTDAFYADIRDTIESGDIKLIGVFNANPPFTYSIGMSNLGVIGAEIIIMGIRCSHAALILNNIRDALKKGDKIEPDVRDDRWANLPCIFRFCDDKVWEYAFQVERYYGWRKPIYQMVMPDAKGRFPEDPNFDHEYMNPRQPLLYTS